MIAFKHVYAIQRGENGSYTATFPALPDVGGVGHTPEDAVYALRAALVPLLRDIEEGKEDKDVLPHSLNTDEIIGFGVLEATSSDEITTEEEE